MIDLRPISTYVTFRVTLFLAYYSMLFFEKLYGLTNFLFTKSVKLYSKAYSKVPNYHRVYWLPIKSEIPTFILKMEHERYMNRKRKEKQ